MDVESALNLLDSIHETQVDSVAPPKKRGKYASRACDACKRNHLKCDGNTPQCSHCAKNGAQCSWNVAPSKRGRKRKITSLEADQLSSLESSDQRYDVAALPTARKAPRTLIVSTADDALLNKNNGHFRFIVGAYYNNLRYFLDLPSSGTFIHHPDMWSNFTSRSFGTSDIIRLNTWDTKSLIYWLEYAAAGVLGCLNSCQFQLQGIFSTAAEAALHEALNERELHLSPNFAPFADCMVSSMLSLCYHYCFSSRFNKWRQLALQAWEVALLFPAEIRPQTRQTLLAMLLGTEQDPSNRLRWQELCLAVPSQAASSLNQASMWLSLSTFFPARFSHEFVWNKTCLMNLTQPTAQIELTLGLTSSAARASIQPVLETDVAQKDFASTIPAWNIMLSASDVLHLLAAQDITAAKKLAKASLRHILDHATHDNTSNLPFYSCTGVFICALASVDVDREVAIRGARELQRIGTPKTTSLASIILSAAAEAPSSSASAVAEFDISDSLHSASATDSPSPSNPSFSAESPVTGPDNQPEFLEAILGLFDVHGPVSEVDFADM